MKKVSPTRAGRTHTPRYGAVPRARHAPSDPVYVPRTAPSALPAVVDNRKWCPPVMEQQHDDCVAHAVSAAMRYAMARSGKPDVPLSRLQNYWDARVIEGVQGVDDGCYVHDGVSAAVKNGIGHETLWPYTSNVLSRPAGAVYADARAFQALGYAAIPAGNLTLLKQALADGNVVVFGWFVYSMETMSDADRLGAIYEAPAPGTPVMGLHCSYAWGYGQWKTGYGADTISFRNSWGAGWGPNNGDGAIDAAWLSTSMFDAVVISGVG